SARPHRGLAVDEVQRTAVTVEESGRGEQAIGMCTAAGCSPAILGLLPVKVLEAVDAEGGGIPQRRARAADVEPHLEALERLERDPTHLRKPFNGPGRARLRRTCRTRAPLWLPGACSRRSAVCGVGAEPKPLRQLDGAAAFAARVAVVHPLRRIPPSRRVRIAIGVTRVPTREPPLGALENTAALHDLGGDAVDELLVVERRAIGAVAGALVGR